MEAIDREDAITSIASRLVAGVSPNEREGLILDCWSLDESHPLFARLPPSVQAEILAEELPSEFDAERYTPVVVLALATRLKKCSNAYLAEELRRLGLAGATVTGPEPNLLPCLCCSFRTIEKRGDHDICPACYWEDDGIMDPNRISAANRMSLAEARANYERIGAAEERLKNFIATDARRRYLR